MRKDGDEGTTAAQFEGFTRLDANFLYCPNQFLDVCLPQGSRGVVRLVAYLLDQTLGWLDKDGQPRSQNITVSYRQLIESAGISRGAIRATIDDAIAAGYVHCVLQGRPATAGESGEQAAYALRWDHRKEYQARPETFQGFFAGNGHRTPVPNAFFRHVIPREPLTVTKVVGIVLRHTIGYQNQFGGRRTDAPLSYRYIQDVARIPDPKSLSHAISSAIASNYIVCVDAGRFHPNPGQRKPASYAVSWLRTDVSTPGGSGSPAGERSNLPSSPAVQDSQPEQSENPSRSGSEIPVAERSNNASKEKTTPKDISKQQHGAHAAAIQKGIELLLNAGFDAAAAERLATVATEEQITRQVEWLPRRNPEQNRLGMLRRAIEENWSEPEKSKDAQTLNRERRERNRERTAVDEQENADQAVERKRRQEHRLHLLEVWDGLPPAEQQRIEAAAFEHQQGSVLRNLFRTRASHRLRECLAELDRQLFHGR